MDTFSVLISVLHGLTIQLDKLGAVSDLDVSQELKLLQDIIDSLTEKMNAVGGKK